MSTKSAFLVVFQATVAGQLAQVDFSTIRNPLNSRQVRRDCEGVARKAFERFAADLGQTFAGSDPIKCVEIVEVREDAETGTTESIARPAQGGH
jgi:hypothetical protein